MKNKLFVKLRGSGSTKNNLTKRETFQLLRSNHADTRIRVLESTPVPYRKLKKLCHNDPDGSVRETIWKLIEKRLTESDALALVLHGYPDTRLNVIQSEMLTRERCCDVCCNDENAMVRAAAWEKIRDDLTKTEAYFLTQSSHADVRKATLPKFFKMAAADEFRTFVRSSYEDVISALAEHPNTPREILLIIAKRNASEYQKKALARILKGPTPENLQSLSSHRDQATRLAIANHPSVAKETLLKLSQDAKPDIRKAAVPRLLEIADEKDLEHLIQQRRYYYPSEETLLAVAEHPGTPKQILHKLALRRTPNVEKITASRILQDATPKDLEGLSNHRDQATRLTVANHPSTPKNALFTLSCDRDQEVRKVALPRFLGIAEVDDFEKFVQRIGYYGSEDVLTAVVEHPRTPHQALRQIVFRGSGQVQEKAASRLLENPDDDDYKALLKSPNREIKEKAIIKIVQDQNMQARELILSHVHDESLRKKYL